jgi:hypothetical protein
MSERIHQDQRRFSPAVLARRRYGGPSAALLGGTCVILGAACLALTFWNGDFAVQSGAVLLGMSLGASGIIAFLAGDR